MEAVSKTLLELIFFFPGPSLIAAFYAEEIILAKKHIFVYLLFYL